MILKTQLPGSLRQLGWLLLLVASLPIVTWRQTAGVAREQALRELESERAIASAERTELERRLRVLSARSRVMRVARERLGMRLPSDDEVILLPLLVESETTFSPNGDVW